MSGEGGDVIIRIVATDDEVAEGFDRVEQKAMQLEQQVLIPTEMRVRDLFQTLRMLDADARKTFIGIDGMIRNSFAIMRTVLRVMGVTFDAVAQSTMALFEVMIQSMRDISAVIANQAAAAAGVPGVVAFGPVKIASVAAGIGLSLASSVMLVAAQASARQEFFEIQARLGAASMTLDLITR
jgi:hypothetical protein